MTVIAKLRERGDDLSLMAAVTLGAAELALTILSDWDGDPETANEIAKDALEIIQRDLEEL